MNTFGFLNLGGNNRNDNLRLASDLKALALSANVANIESTSHVVNGLPMHNLLSSGLGVTAQAFSPVDAHQVKYSGAVNASLLPDKSDFENGFVFEQLAGNMCFGLGIGLGLGPETEQGNVNTESTSQPLGGNGLPLVNLQSSRVGRTSQIVPPPGTQVVQLPGTLSAGLVPEKFDGTDCTTWLQKMHFFLTTVKLERFLKEDKLVMSPDKMDVRPIASQEAWIYGDFLCKGCVLNHLSDPLYKVYSKAATSEDLWCALEKIYKTEDACSKKFTVTKFLNFKMVNSKPVMEQDEVIQLMAHEIIVGGIPISEKFQVAAFIEKLPPTWKDFKSYLMHKRKPKTMEDLILKLRVEEFN